MTVWPNVPKLPASCQPERIAQDWCDAEAAYRRRDSGAVASAFYPRELGDVETYTRTVGLTMLAAQVCGAEVRKQHARHPLLGFYGLSVEDIRTGLAVDPFAGIKEANVVAAGRMLVAAANEDYQQLADLVRAHLQFDGDAERSGVLLDLLGLYVAMADEEG